VVFRIYVCSGLALHLTLTKVISKSSNRICVFVWCVVCGIARMDMTCWQRHKKQVLPRAHTARELQDRRRLVNRMCPLPIECVLSRTQRETARHTPSRVHMHLHSLHHISKGRALHGVLCEARLRAAPPRGYRSCCTTHSITASKKAEEGVKGRECERGGRGRQGVKTGTNEGCGESTSPRACTPRRPRARPGSLMARVGREHRMN